MRIRLAWLGLAICALIAVLPVPALAYIGPGAGFTFVTSFFLVFVTFFLACLTLLTWPIRWAVQKFRGRKALAGSQVKRVVVVGLDGLDPELTDDFMKQGLLPNLERLASQGSYTRLRTTLPPESPVAWSSFSTGCNPGRHQVFDFLVPNRKSYLPELCASRINPPARMLSVGPYQIPLGKPRIQFERRSQSFWKILGDYGVYSTILRVPITFPPERFNGLQLSAMSVPDLKGSQGTFSYYTSDPVEQSEVTGGQVIDVKVEDGAVQTYISGPENALRKDGAEMRLPFTVHLGRDGSEAELELDGQRYALPLRGFSAWIQVRFRAGLGVRVQGICRFYLKAVEPYFQLYMTPINIDPGKPALPISYPFPFSMYLAKTQGHFTTLGLAEDTWALNERVLDEDAFMEQAYLIHDERERMFFDALDKTNRGLLTCVFDVTDRMQHMFWRYLEADHPANVGKDVDKHQHAIRDLYVRMDDLVGRVMSRVDDETLLVVMSDHGCKSFQRGVNINSWLYRNGYLSLVSEPTGAEWFHGVDWSKTQAYAIGLGGIYLNLEGRESQGIVKPHEVDAIKQGIRDGLKKLHDDERGASAIKEVYDTQETYAGPYVEDAPDLIVGAHVGYRVSWTCATGAVAEDIFEDNVKSWSGDHCINPDDIPGVLFTNRPIAEDDPSIMDVGPTILDLFGVPVPAYCDGHSLMPKSEER